MTAHRAAPAHPTQVETTRAWWVRHALLPLLLWAAAMAVLRLGGADHAVTGTLFDPLSQRWLLDAHGAGRALHEGERLLIGAVMLAALVAMTWRRWRRPASYLLLCFALTTSLVSFGKHTTNVACPRNLAEYGGTPRQDGLCFPAGHSSAAFSLVALYFLLGERQPRRRWAGLAAGLVLGLTFAATQWARGMHFPSHDLTSAAIAWSIALVAYTAVYRRRLWGPGHAPAAD